MTLVLSRGLPAAGQLRAEGHGVEETRDCGSGRAFRCFPGRILPAGLRRPPALRVALLNLMPDKPTTELQFARLLAGTGRRIELQLFLPDGYEGRHSDPGHLARHYRRWSGIRAGEAGAFDGLIVTGAPLETLAFEAVDWWPEFAEILDWAERQVPASLFVCWAAQAALFHRHGVAKRMLPEKRFGVFRQETLSRLEPSLEGLPDRFDVPVSRHSEVREADLPWGRGLTVAARSAESGLSIVADGPRRALHLFDHLEYDADTLAREYRRDLAARRAVPLPRNYFPGNRADLPPRRTWRAAAQAFYAGWIGALEKRRLSMAA